MLFENIKLICILEKVINFKKGIQELKPVTKH